MLQFERKVTFYPHSERENYSNRLSLKAVEAELLSLPIPPFLYPSISHSHQPWMLLQMISLHLSCSLTVVPELYNNLTHVENTLLSLFTLGDDVS